MSAPRSIQQKAAQDALRFHKLAECGHTVVVSGFQGMPLVTIARDGQKMSSAVLDAGGVGDIWRHIAKVASMFRWYAEHGIYLK